MINEDVKNAKKITRKEEPKRYFSVIDLPMLEKTHILELGKD